MNDRNRRIAATLAGVEPYFSDLKRAGSSCADVLQLQLIDEDETRYAKFEPDPGFVCLERRGSEACPSYDKEVLFLDVKELLAAVAAYRGRSNLVTRSRAWALLHDPDGKTFCCSRDDLLRPDAETSEWVAGARLAARRTMASYFTVVYSLRTLHS